MVFGSEFLELHNLIRLINLGDTMYYQKEIEQLTVELLNATNENERQNIFSKLEMLNTLALQAMGKPAKKVKELKKIDRATYQASDLVALKIDSVVTFTYREYAPDYKKGDKPILEEKVYADFKGFILNRINSRQNNLIALQIGDAVGSLHANEIYGFKLDSLKDLQVVSE
jgi:hypothetical protein